MTTVGTKNGRFSVDELVGVALYSFVENDLKIVRTADKEVLDTMDTLIGVGAEYDPLEELYDHNVLKESNLLYGLSSAGLVWLDMRDHMIWKYGDVTYLEVFIGAIGQYMAGTTYGTTKLYLVVFEAVERLNDENLYGTVQDFIFEVLVGCISNILDALGSNDIPRYTELVEKLKDLSGMENTTI